MLVALPGFILECSEALAYCREDPICSRYDRSRLSADAGAFFNEVGDPTGLWPIGLPHKSDAQQKLPGILQQMVPNLTPQEAQQLSSDAIQKLGWPDIFALKTVTPDIEMQPCQVQSVIYPPRSGLS
jgi:hypothetical protein